MSSKKIFGDFQTPKELASKSVALIDHLFGKPDAVVEPTMGVGNFLQASLDVWKEVPEYHGYEINKEYVALAHQNFKQSPVRIFHSNFFDENWQENLAQFDKKSTLIVGNPPWVTNSALGQLKGDNLPNKKNNQRLRGLDALTGKSNFDIAEWMIIQLIEALPSTSSALAMLCKTMTARKVLKYFWKQDKGLKDSVLFRIDAKAEFGVAVDACLFFTTNQPTIKCEATVFTALNGESKSTRIGFIDNCLVSDVVTYQTYRSLNKESKVYTWRSGIKHDAAKVMEFTFHENQLVNGFGEIVTLEDEYIYPLLKSSDLGNNRSIARKAVLITQKHTGDDTSIIQQVAPMTWAYLMRYSHVLDKRKSSIYKKRSRFSVFGIGDYSFAPWKVAISGLYKKISFMIVNPNKDRTVMLDDTCYFIACRSCEEATLIYELLSSAIAHNYLQSMIFWDSKRPITIDILRQLSLQKLAVELGRAEALQSFVEPDIEEKNIQMSLFSLAIH